MLSLSTGLFIDTDTSNLHLESPLGKDVLINGVAINGVLIELMARMQLLEGENAALKAVLEGHGGSIADVNTLALSRNDAFCNPVLP